MIGILLGAVLMTNSPDDFHVQLPSSARPIPEPLAKGQKPGFALRGTKGWKWTPEQYLREIPFLKRAKMNFLMNCYTSMCDVEHYAWGDMNVNRWWEPLPAEKKAAYEKVVRACQKSGITFCFSMNPNLLSKRPLRYDSKEDFEALWQHYAWMQGLGVHWFNVSLDDISSGIDATGQARTVNAMFRRLKAHDPAAKFIFCPTQYWGDGTDAETRPYLEVLAKDLDPDIYLFWTGDKVYGPVTVRAATSYRDLAKHRLILWDNYPVNDDNPTMHLGPNTGLQKGIEQVLDGYMGNPLCKQDVANRIPLLTCADFAYNPSAYDSGRSIGQAIFSLGKTNGGRLVLKRLVEAYPGFRILGGTSGLNPVRQRFELLRSDPEATARYVLSIETLQRDLARELGGEFADAARTLADDVAWMRAQLKPEP